MRRISLTLIVLCIVLAGCNSKANDAKAEAKPDEAGKSIEVSPEAQRIAGIETSPASLRSMTGSLTVPGVISSTTKNSAMVTPPVAGRVISLKSQLGDSVIKGQTLAVIESSELAQSWQSVAESRRLRDSASADLQQAISAKDIAEAKVRADTITLVRQRELARAGAFSQAPLQQAQSELNDAQTELLDIQRQLDYHMQQLQRNELLFKEGVVARADLDTARLNAQMDQNRIGKARVRVDIAKEALQRERSISQKGLLNAREVETAEADLRSSRLERDKAKVAIDSSRRALANSEKTILNAQATYRTLSGGGSGSGGQVAIMAPISGTITRLDVTNGQAVDRTQSLMGIDNLTNLWAIANVQERDAGRVAVGAPCEVTSTSLEGRSFRGVVQIVASRLDPKTRSMQVHCLVDGSTGFLKPEMYVNVRIGLTKPKRALVVAATALVKDGDKSYVFVKQGDKFDRREVTSGTVDVDFAEILDGLKEGEQVAVKGSFVLNSESKKDQLKGDD